MFLQRNAGQAGAFQAEGTGQSLEVGTRWTDAGSTRWEGLIGLISQSWEHSAVIQVRVRPCGAPGAEDWDVGEYAKPWKVLSMWESDCWL